jgi:pyridoxal phosphate enzyme (YggS family)
MIGGCDFTRAGNAGAPCVQGVLDHQADLPARMDTVLTQIADAARTAGRLPEDVTLVAVSKTVGRPAVDEAFALGLRRFGENRVQDAQRKFAEPLPAGGQLHLIGQLQSNKTKSAVALFDVIESVYRPSLIEALEKEAARRGQPYPVLLQVNIAREPQKAGCDPDHAPQLMERLVSSSWLQPHGLMTMAPLVVDPEDVRPVFAQLRTLRDALRRLHPDVELQTLSMGMSNDFRVAIEEGATSVRIGRAIFGE